MISSAPVHIHIDSALLPSGEKDIGCASFLLLSYTEGRVEITGCENETPGLLNALAVQAFMFLLEAKIAAKIKESGQRQVRAVLTFWGLRNGVPQAELDELLLDFERAQKVGGDDTH